MKKVKILIVILSLCVLCCGSYYASDESGTTVPPNAITSITVDKEAVSTSPAPDNNTTLTPDGNVSLIDDILQSDSFASVEETDTLENMQFITIQTRSGNYFYLVIDRSGNTENVYFLNLVDESDLLALLDEAGIDPPTPVCICSDLCVLGSINTQCEVCTADKSSCIGKEPEPHTSPVIEPDVKPESRSTAGIVIVIILILAIGGGGAFYICKNRGHRNNSGKNAVLDDYDDEYMEFDAYEQEEENKK